MASLCEITILNDLAHATCHSADRLAAAARACADSYRGLVLDQCCDDRRRLVVDILRCLLLRGVPVPIARLAITPTSRPPFTGVDLDVLWIDVEMAERKLHRALSRAAQAPPRRSGRVCRTATARWCRLSTLDVRLELLSTGDADRVRHRAAR